MPGACNDNIERLRHLALSKANRTSLSAELFLNSFTSLDVAAPGLLQPSLGLAIGVRQIARELRRPGAVHHAGIARKRHGQHWAHSRLSIHSDNSIGNTPDRQYRGLRWPARG